MKNIVNKIQAFLADEQGAETVEWVMIAAILAAIITAVFWGQLQAALSAAITGIAGQMANPTGG
jgi:Flp pilus assembly pilin Flp